MQKRYFAVIGALTLSLLMLASCGEKSKLDDATSMEDITSAVSAVDEGASADALWIQSYEWESVKDTKDTPALGDAIAMPADAERLLEAYPVAEVILSGGDSQIVRPATDLLSMDDKVESYGEIYLYSEDDPFGNLNRRNVALEVLVPVGTDMTLGEMLEDGMWCIQGGAFSLDEFFPNSYDYSYEQTAAALDAFIQKYGAPDHVTNAAVEDGAGSYLLLWDVGDAAYGLYVKDAHYQLDGVETKSLYIGSADYYAPAYMDTMREIQEEFFEVLPLVEFVVKLG